MLYNSFLELEVNNKDKFLCVDFELTDFIQATDG